MVTSFRPTSFRLARSTPSLSNWKPLSHVRSPVNPGAPEGGTYGCAANGVPCVIDEPAIVAARPWENVAAKSGSGCTGGGAGGGAGAGRESREDIHRLGNDDVTSDEGVKTDCVRCTSGVDILMGAAGRDGEREGSDLIDAPTADSVQLDLRVGCREVRSRCSSSVGSRSSSELSPVDDEGRDIVEAVDCVKYNGSSSCSTSSSNRLLAGLGGPCNGSVICVPCNGTSGLLCRVPVECEDVRDRLLCVLALDSGLELANCRAMD